MKNVEQNNDSTQDNATGATSITCPNGVAWCALHDDGDYCWSRTVSVGEADIAISNGTTSGRPKVWGLADFEDDALEVDVALKVAAAIAELAAELAAEVGR